MVNNKTKKTLSVLMLFTMLLSLIFCITPPKAEASTITLYPNSYTYVKPAPYWTCDPFDEFPATQQVTILERDYNFFYVEYTRNGQVRRGYIGMEHFNEADYAGYSWCSHPVFTPGYNNSGVSKTTYYSPTGSVSSGAIDADEGTNANKPILVLRYEGSRAFIQYVTNPGSISHPKFKRAWIDSSCITLAPPTGNNNLSSTSLVMIKNKATNRFLQATADSSASNGYSITTGVATGDSNQLWFVERYTSNYGTYYKIKNDECSLYMEVKDKVPVLDLPIILTPASSPNKAQEFAIDLNNGYSRIYTRCSGNFELLSWEGTTLMQALNNGSNNGVWELQHLNKYFDNFYANLDRDGEMKILRYYIDPSITNVGWEDEIRTATGYWNAIAPVTRIRLYSTNDLTAADILITTESISSLGITYGYTNSEAGNFTDNRTNNLGLTLSRSKIIISPELDSANVIYTATHELGHALKLKHPFYQFDGTITLDDIDMDQVAKSVMNQGLYNSSYPKNVLPPSNYDKRTLINKWYNY